METESKATPSLGIDRNDFKVVDLSIDEIKAPLISKDFEHDEKLNLLFKNNLQETNSFIHNDKEDLFNKFQNIKFSKNLKIASFATIFTITSAIIGINFLSKNDNDIIATASTKAYNIPDRTINIPLKTEEASKEKNNFITHKVTKNDTLSTIAIKYKTTIASILKNNSIKNPDFLSLDTELKIPTNNTIENKEVNKTINKEDKKIDDIRPKENKETSKTFSEDKKGNTSKEVKKQDIKKILVNKKGASHTIKSGETIGYLAKIYGVSENKILSSNPNLKPFNIQIGQKVFIPGNINRNGSRKIAYIKSSRSLSSPNYPNNRRMFFPTKGDFSSSYGYRWNRLHSGIDIANYVGTPIYAALSGTVIEAGWDSGYGNSIKIRHNNGLVTRYAHCSKMLVSIGEYVEAGQTIGKIGTTGRVTGPHLHFEVIVNGTPVDPRKYL